MEKSLISNPSPFAPTLHFALLQHSWCRIGDSWWRIFPSHTRYELPVRDSHVATISVQNTFHPLVVWDSNPGRWNMRRRFAPLYHGDGREMASLLMVYLYACIARRGLHWTPCNGLRNPHGALYTASKLFSKPSTLRAPFPILTLNMRAPRATIMHEQRAWVCLSRQH